MSARMLGGMVRRVGFASAPRPTFRKFSSKALPVEFAVLDQSHVAAATALIAETFAQGEPMTATLGIDRADFSRFSGAFVKATAGTGFSTVATIDGEVVGAVISDDLMAPLVTEKHPVFSTPQIDMGKWVHILGLLEDLDTRYLSSLKPTPVPGQLFHQFLAGVASDRTGMGIAQRMCALNLNQGKNMGFQKAVTETTGRFSLKAQLKNGYERQVSTQYAEFVSDGQKPFTDCESRTTHFECVLLARSL